MFARILKIFGIVVLCGIFMFGAIEVWVYRNKEMIFRKAQEIANENLNGHLEIGDFKFRPFHGGLGLNFTLSDVKLVDDKYSIYKKPFLEAQFMHVALDLKGFYRGNIKIRSLVLQDGDLKLFVTKDGYSNLSIFQNASKKKKKSDDGDNSIAKKLGNVRFINFGVNYSDSLKQQYFGALFHDAANVVTETDSTVNAEFTGNVLFSGLTFKPKKGGFLVNQETKLNLSIGLDDDAKKLKIYPSILTSSTNDDIRISGEFDFSDTVRLFRMTFGAKQIEVKNALPLLAKRLQEQIDSIGVQTKVDTEVKIFGQLAGQQPRVDVSFVTNKFNYELPVGTLRSMQASGKFTNQADSTKIPDIRNSSVTAPKITGLFETVPFTLKLAVNDFRDPRATLDARVEGDSTNLGDLLDPQRYRIKHGSADVDFHFRGSLKHFYNAKQDKFDGKVWGKVSLNDVSMDYLPRKVRLSKIKGDFTFNEKIVSIPNLHFYDSQNMLYVRGRMLDLIPYLFGSPKPLRADVDINIPSWQLNWLEGLFAQKTQVTTRNKKLRLSELLDNAIDKMEVVAKLDAKKLKYRNFSAHDLKGKFSIKDNAVGIEYFVMKAFGKGNVRISGVMDNSGTKQPHLAVKGKITDANVHSVFYSFDNFGQKSITHDNLKGTLNTEFDFESQLTNNVKLIPSSMRGHLHFDLTDGHIINFEPFMKMKRLIFKKRNFEEVKFAPIRNNVRLSGQEIEIAPMEIESNVLTLYLDGVYSFGKKTDINIQIPLSNLKKRDSTYVLDPNNEEKKEGSKIFLRALDENGEVNIKLAFRRKKGKNKKEEVFEAEGDSIQR